MHGLYTNFGAGIYPTIFGTRLSEVVRNDAYFVLPHLATTRDLPLRTAAQTHAVIPANFLFEPAEGYA